MMKQTVQTSLSLYKTEITLWPRMPLCEESSVVTSRGRQRHCGFLLDRTANPFCRATQDFSICDLICRILPAWPCSQDEVGVPDFGAVVSGLTIDMGLVA
jgi:hypothetical protein